MIYVWIGIAIVILFLIGRIIRWWNLPEVAKARAAKVKSRQENRTERVRIRREGRGGWFRRRKKNKESLDGKIGN